MSWIFDEYIKEAHSITDAVPFTNDPAKMRDFRELSKDAFLQSYSYLTEAEYNATADRVKVSPPKKWLLTASKDGINVDFEAILECDTKPDFWACYEIADTAGCTLWSIDELDEE